MENITNKTLVLKKCKKCGKEKDIKLFRNQSNSKDLKFPWCRSCQDKESKNNYLQNKIRRLELVKNWQQKNQDKIKVYKKNWALRRKEVIQKSIT